MHSVQAWRAFRELVKKKWADGLVAEVERLTIRILTLQEMLSDLYSKTKTAVVSSEVGRLLQIIKASGWKP